MKSSIDALQNLGVATVVASGNNSCNGTGCINALSVPACISTAISVGATTKSNTVPGYSNTASFLNLFAPGGDLSGGTSDIYSSVPGGSFDYEGGTSMAAPHVAGAFAVLKQQSPSASVSDLLSVLKATGVPITDSRNNVIKPRIRLANNPWVARYIGTDVCCHSKISGDGSGNVYVVATDSSWIDIIKYDPYGRQIWAANLNFLLWPAVADIATDTSANFYITGDACATVMCDSFIAFTAKYDSTGSQQWIQTSSSSQYNLPAGVKVDANGNVYTFMLAFSWPPSPSGSQFVTIKYDSSGNSIWTRTYTNGSTMSTTGGASGLVLDGSGNLYVTGTFCTDPLLPCQLGDNYYVIVKYDANGTMLWTANYNSGYLGQSAGIVVDGSGNVAIGGAACYAGDACYSNYSLESGAITLKYAPTGNLLWHNMYQNLGLTTPTALAADSTGNVYVAGESCSAVTQILDPNIGTLYHTCGDYDIVTIKYDANGGQSWMARYSGAAAGPDGQGRPELPYAIVVDRIGNSYVAGKSGFNGGYSLMKYDPNGNQLWILAHNEWGYADSIALDILGNVYASGLSRNGDGINILTMKAIQ
jgi:Subtilase family